MSLSAKLEAGESGAGNAHFTHQQILKVITGILLCIFLPAIDQTVVIPAVPAMAAELSGFNHLSWIISAYLLTSTAATPIYGKLSDIYGRRRLLLIAIVIFAIASALCAMAGSLWQLIAARALQGLGGAGLMAMAQAAIADVVSPRERGRYQGYMAGTWAIASILGPIIGGWVTQNSSWRWIFWINLPFSALALLLVYRALSLLRVKRVEAKIDYLGAALLTAGVTAWLLVLSWGGAEYPWLSVPILSLVALGCVLIAVLVWWERRAVDPIIPPRLFRQKIVAEGVALAFCGALALFAGTFLLPLFFQLVAGADAESSGLLVVPFLGSNCLGAYGAGLAARRLGTTRPPLLVGFAGCVIGFLLLATVGLATPHWVTAVWQLILGTSIGIVMPSVLVAVQNAAERRDVGVATGVLLFLRSMGGAFGSTMVAAILMIRFGAALRKLGITANVQLSDLHGGGVLAGVPAASQAALQGALAGAFHVAFLACAVVLAMAFVLALRLPDMPLRASSAAEPAPVGH
jgi:EmrB/QacA subfamily drug resistance transporter